MERDGAPADCPQLSLRKQRLDQWPVGPEGEGNEKERERCCEENWGRQSWGALGVGPQKLPPSQGC